MTHRPRQRAAARCYKEKQMITLGIILLVIGLLVASLNVLVTIGVVLIVVGLILALMGRSGRSVGGRSHWW
jgi:membrane-bound ClpP family serine protease